jgi:hypothetical protein
MINKDDVKNWSETAAAVLAGITILWNFVKVQWLSAKWDGFKLEYDRLNRSESHKEGELAARNQERDRQQDEQHRQEDRADRKEK